MKQTRFCSPCRSLFEQAKNCWSRSFCRVNTSLQSLILNYVEVNTRFKKWIKTFIHTRNFFQVDHRQRHRKHYLIDSRPGNKHLVVSHGNPHNRRPIGYDLVENERTFANNGLTGNKPSRHHNHRATKETIISLLLETRKINNKLLNILLNCSRNNKNLWRNSD